MLNKRIVLDTKFWTNFAVVLVVLLAFFAAARSQVAVNHDRATQNQLDQTLVCIKSFNEHQGEALSARDAVVNNAIEHEIHLWSQYNRLYKEATKDPNKLVTLQNKLNEAIRNYRLALIDMQQNRLSYPYAKPDVLEDC